LGESPFETSFKIMKYTDIKIKPAGKKFKKLHPSTKKKWVEALRSGKYAQGTHALYRDNRTKYCGSEQYCCLGVLGVVQGVTKNNLKGHDLLGKDFGKLRSVLLQDTDKVDSLEACLAEYNDEGATFKQLARWVEENL